MKQRNLVGQRFGHLLVIESLGKQSATSNHFYSKVRCDCGAEYAIRDTTLIGGVKSCKKCNKNKLTHGMTNTRLFNIWQKMRVRCYSQTSVDYKDYGGRGICICEQWKNDFKNFYDWANANGYSEDLSIDRIDVNGNYEPSNCRWANSIEQANNKRNNVYIVYKGKRKTISQWSKELNINPSTLSNRLNAGWELEKALNTPVTLGRNQYSV